MKKKKTILFVDDDKDILDSVKIFLESEGFDIKTENTGKNLKNPDHLTELPDLILLDVLISGVDGRELCKTLKSNTRTSKVPIILVSAHPSASKEKLLYSNDDFVEKPFDIYELLGTINKHINK